MVYPRSWRQRRWKSGRCRWWFRRELWGQVGVLFCRESAPVVGHPALPVSAPSAARSASRRSSSAQRTMRLSFQLCRRLCMKCCGRLVSRWMQPRELSWSRASAMILVGVRVHTDSKAAESARAVNALAYTIGCDVGFGTGQYQPTTNVGQRIVAHELTHVMQQSDDPISDGTLELGAVNSPHEYEAASAAVHVGDSPRGSPLTRPLPKLGHGSVRRGPTRGTRRSRRSRSCRWGRHCDRQLRSGAELWQKCCYTVPGMAERPAELPMSGSGCDSRHDHIGKRSESAS